MAIDYIINVCVRVNAAKLMTIILTFRTADVIISIARVASWAFSIITPRHTIEIMT